MLIFLFIFFLEGGRGRVTVYNLSIPDFIQVSSKLGFLKLNKSSTDPHAQKVVKVSWMIILMMMHKLMMMLLMMITIFMMLMIFLGNMTSI